MDEVWNGGLPAEHAARGGFSRGYLGYHPREFEALGKGELDAWGGSESTWAVGSRFVPRFMHTWYKERGRGGKGEDGVEEEELSWIARMHDGKVYLPNMIVHPRKTQ